MNLIQIGRMTEEQAREYIEHIRWPEEPICPHCGCSDRIYPLNGKATRAGLYKCGDCREQFTVTVGTVMEDSHLSMKQWIIAFHLMCSSKKGVSALQLQRELGIGSYKSAWHLAHRIRAAMKEEPLRSSLEGIVEVDETYVGGKRKPGSRRGRGTKKTPVMVLVSRNGKAHSRRVERVSAKELKGAIHEVVHSNSQIITDEWRAYAGIGKEFVGGHETVNHGDGEYARGDVHVNAAESYFALLKRGVHGIFHHVSKKHLPRYLCEFDFRWNARKVTDGERTEGAIKGAGGKRLLYSDPIAP